MRGKAHFHCDAAGYAGRVRYLGRARQRRLTSARTASLWAVHSSRWASSSSSLATASRWRTTSSSTAPLVFDVAGSAAATAHAHHRTTRRRVGCPDKHVAAVALRLFGDLVGAIRSLARVVVLLDALLECRRDRGRCRVDARAAADGHQHAESDDADDDHEAHGHLPVRHRSPTYRAQAATRTATTRITSR